MRLQYYLLRRLLLAIPMFLIVVSAVFVVMHIIPGDPVRAMLGERAPAEAVEALRHTLGLDKPIYLQYSGYLWNLVRGDLGTSLFTLRPVSVEVLYAFPVTFELVTVSMLVSTAIGIPLGIYSAIKRGRIADFVIRAVSLLGFSVPVFWLALMLQWYFGRALNILPLESRLSFSTQLTRITGVVILDSILTMNFAALIDGLAHLVMPAIALSAIMVPLISRVTRSNMIEVMGEDYMVTAKSKGLSASKVIYKHAFRNAILPIFTVVGVYYALGMGGAVLTETIFNFPGMGKLLLDSIARRDYLLIQGCVTMYAIAIIIITTLIDVIYAFLDPRVSS